MTLPSSIFVTNENKAQSSTTTDSSKRGSWIRARSHDITASLHKLGIKDIGLAD